MLPDVATLKRTRYPGIYRRALTNGTLVYDAKATYRGQQKWARGKRLEHEAREAQVEMLRAMQEGRMAKAPASLTLQAYIETRWLPHKQVTRPQSYDTYRFNARHIIRDLGDRRLVALRGDDVQTFITGLFTKHHLAPRTCTAILAAFSDAMHWAMKWELIARNPCQWVQAAEAEDRELPNVDADLLRGILAHAAGSEIELAVVVALALGMREKEIIELCWPNVDFGARVVTIQRATTKSEKGRRMLLMGPELAARLQRHRLEQMRLFKENGLPMPERVFLRARGEAWTPGMLRYRWNPIAKAAGHEGLHFHDLRHINSTLMGKAGIHTGVMQKRLGHAKIEQTMDYTHFDVSDQQGAVATVEASMWG